MIVRTGALSVVWSQTFRYAVEKELKVNTTNEKFSNENLCFQYGTKSFYLKNQKGKYTTQGIPKWSPTKVLTLPNTV